VWVFAYDSSDTRTEGYQGDCPSNHH